MSRAVRIPVVDGSITKTFSSFLTELHSKGVIEGSLVPLELPSGNNVVQTLVTNPAKYEKASPFAPVMPVNSARIMQSMTKLGPSAHNIALVMRPCEARALVDLVKLKQASLENTLLISYDCYGAMPLKKFQKSAAEKKQHGDDFLNIAFQNKLNDDLRWNCQVCQYPSPLVSDITVAFVGHEKKTEELLLIASSQAGEAALVKAGYELDTIGDDREKAVKEWIKQRTQNREKMLEEARVAASGPEKMLDFLSTCIHCLNCMTNCPVCYCRECFFNSSTFELEADKYFDWAQSRGGIRMPNDTLFFHITRMTHMSTSCVACGACSEACPSEIEIAKLFTVVSERTQKLYDYVSGRSLEEELPLSTFKEEELEEFEK